MDQERHIRINLRVKILSYCFRSKSVRGAISSFPTFGFGSVSLECLGFWDSESHNLNITFSVANSHFVRNFHLSSCQVQRLFIFQVSRCWIVLLRRTSLCWLRFQACRRLIKQFSINWLLKFEFPACALTWIFSNLTRREPVCRQRPWEDLAAILIKNIIDCQPRTNR